ncbi:MAG: radical SAM protein [Flavobacteriales bacterium]|jgi:pyruvate-formate lyase-activating enzyme|nr:radical SAM protein [Flavobacteriales bacterium]
MERRSGFLPDRTIHLHPTRLCNLQCLHCYSSSGMQYKEALDPVAIGRALAVLKTEGYEMISLSGGEPLVYRSLRGLIEQAKEMGYRVTMISNGLLVNARMEDTLALLDGIAISFDGLAGTHDRIRARAGAYAHACHALEYLADQGRPVAAAISITRDALPELPELAMHLASLGARALQIRPVALAGRARTMEGFAPYSETDRARLYLVALALGDELAASVRVSCDLVPAMGLWQQRDAYAGLLGSCQDTAYHERLLSDLVNPLVITDEGALKPIAYDFNERFNIAHIDGLSDESIARYKQKRLAPFQSLLGSVLHDCRTRKEMVDWFDRCTRASETYAG